MKTRKRELFSTILFATREENFPNNLKKSSNQAEILLQMSLQFIKAYFGIEIPRDGRIVKRGKREVVIGWFNPCPVLEALKKVGLDTKTFCRDVYEKPVQILFDELLPYKIIFTRDYNHLRPHKNVCREIYRKKVE